MKWKQTNPYHRHTQMIRVWNMLIQCLSVPQVSFSVSYSMVQSTYIRNFQIATGTLSSLAIVYAGFKTYVWSRRAGRLTIDFPTLINFIFYLCGALSNCFFVIVFGVAFYFFIFYKVGCLLNNLSFLIYWCIVLEESLCLICLCH